jgi:diguanylate cyclase (GGDEF)-like protein/PAS domain S-box-containing protein
MNNGNIQYIKPQGKLHSESLLKMLLEELDCMIYRCRADENWTMEFVSNGCFDLTGYNPDELIYNSRISFKEITHSEDIGRIRYEINSAIANNRPFEIEYRIHHADGSIRWVWERGRAAFHQEDHEEVIHGFIQDITERQNNKEILAETESRYRSIFENTIEGIFQTTPDGNYLDVNPALAHIYGYNSPKELIKALSNISQQLYVLASRRDEFEQKMLKDGSVKNFESQVYKQDRSIIWISENARAVHNPDGQLLYYEGTVEDITERKTFEKEISHQATHDSLTNLPNRSLLKDRLRQYIQNTNRETAQLAILFIDLDHFKNVNDSLGHAAGDVLIKVVAERLQKCMREGDTVARLGGDEFVLALPNIHAGTEIMSHAIQRILDIIQLPCVIEDKEFYIGCSIGVSVFPDDANDVDTLLKNADMAMYKAKQLGRNNFQFFTEELNKIVIESLEMEHDLRQAILEEQFELYFQPKTSVSFDKIIGVEALLRWRMPAKGLISPIEFIPLAEKTGLIETIGKWVIEAACKQLKTWIDKGINITPLSINISPRQFNQTNLLETIEYCLHKYNISAGLLELEITESCMVNDEKRFIQTLNQMKTIGLQLSIDDFGSGYSNLNYLKTMPVDFLKVDRSFIEGIENDDKSRAIYRAIVSIAHNLNLPVISEGVETKEQHDFLRSINCDAIQGFFFSKPLPADEFERLLKK